MRRDTNLQKLSREHHPALIQAKRLLEAGKANPPGSILERFLDFWHGHMQQHFIDEEIHLLPALALAAGQECAEIFETLRQHVELRSRVLALETADQAEPVALHELGELIRAHVRFEENQLFPLIERELQPAQLERIGQLLEPPAGGRAEG